MDEEIEVDEEDVYAMCEIERYEESDRDIPCTLWATPELWENA